MDEALSNVGYVMRSAGGSVTGGKLDPDGMTARIYSKDQVDVELLVGDGDWGVVEDVGVEDLWAEENNEVLHKMLNPVALCVLLLATGCGNGYAPHRAD